MESKRLEKPRPSSADAVNRRVTKGPVTYCQQITKEEYEKQAVDFSRQQIRNLLRSIVDDRSLPCKEVTKRLAQVWRNIHLFIFFLCKFISFLSINLKLYFSVFATGLKERTENRVSLQTGNVIQTSI